MAENDQIKNLSMLLSLMSELHKINNLNDYGFFAVNETLLVMPYQTALFWQKHPTSYIKLRNMSGVSQVDQNSLTALWFKNIIHYCQLKKMNMLRALNKEEFSEHIQQTWPEHLSSQVLWAPLHNKNGKVEAGLIYVRRQVWSENDIKRYAWVHQAYQYSWRCLYQPSRWRVWLEHYYEKRRRPIIIAAGIAAIVIPLFPVSNTVLAPAEIVAHKPAVITSPFQGVIKKVYVRSNQTVNKGEILFSLDDTLLKNESQLAEGRLRTMQAQLKEAVQKGFIDPKSRAEINILSAKVKENDLQLQYNNALLKKVKVRAPKNGIVLYDESHDWTGQPVSTGQKVMTIAQPSQVEMEIWLPVSDAIQFKEGTEVKLFPEGQPFKVIHGTVIYESYSAELSPKKVLAYRLIASI
ncbi:MAG TPA: HlyD family efflux transporter periplasmic adaptor subunit, partial [Coxiellaceae bacterium]|nr:HlyD family efflux transporter periplasmic adaptor subunit [Coxiellaceae bacterium]